MLRFAIPLSGWFLLGSYLFYEYLAYGSSGLMDHFVSPGHALQSIFHLSILSLPLITTYVGYLVHQKDKLLENLATEKAKERSILDAVGDAISIQDREFRILYQNRLHKELQGDHAGEFCYKAYRNKEQVCEGCHTARAMEDGKIHKRERTKTTGNSTRYYEITAAPLADFSGKIVAGIEAVRDMTERKLAEEALRESEEKFSKIFRKAPLLITLSETETGELIEVNKKFLELSGFTREEVIGRTVFELGWISKDQRSRLVQRLREEGRVEGMELSLRSKQGREIICLYSGELITVNGTQRLLSIGQDITQRKHAEGAVRKSEAQYRRLVENLEERHFIYVHGPDGVFTYISPSVEHMLGYTHGEFCTHYTHYLTNNPVNNDAIQHTNLSIQGVKQPPYSIEIYHKDGSTRWLEVAELPVFNEAGAVAGVQGIATDITERYLLQQEQLKTQKLEAIGTLAGGIAHDFNNLLQGVFGYISMAKITFDQKEKALAMLEQAEQALHMSVNLTSQLLTFSKGGKPVRKKLALRPLIENAVKFALSGSGVNYTLEIVEKLRTVEADEGQIGQVIQNIVLNAEQSMPVGGTVMVAARNVHAGGQAGHLRLPKGNYVEISISDSGVGIPEEYLPKIFDPYFTTKERGSGLGLATCYSIIKKHDGIIEVKSEVGKGSTFSIYLPVVEEEAEKTRTLSLPAPDVRKGRILVMDDEELVRNIVGEMIQVLGHEVEFARNGAEAIAKYREALSSGKRFDIVILDLTIRGGMGGEETLRNLISLDPELKAVVSSGYADSSALSEYLARGFRACLTKPYRMESLRNTLDALLR
jgi:PAS domain S-box-containing protein